MLVKKEGVGRLMERLDFTGGWPRVLLLPPSASKCCFCAKLKFQIFFVDTQDPKKESGVLVPVKIKSQIGNGPPFLCMNNFSF